MWRIYSSIGIPNVFTCITSTILFGLTSSYTPEFSQILYRVGRYGAPIYFDIKFLAGDFPQRSCYRNGATVLSRFESRLLKAANVVTYFTTRKGITMPRRIRASLLLLTATIFIRYRICRYPTNDHDRDTM